MFETDAFQDADLLEVRRLAWRTQQIKFTGDFFLKIAAKEPNHFRVARDPESHRVEGFLIAAQQPGTEEDLFLLAVDPAWKGRGIRHALLEDLQRTMTQEDVRELSIEIPLHDRDSIDFFRREGFTVVGIEPDPRRHGSDSLYLSKSLSRTAPKLPLRRAWMRNPFRITPGP